MTIYQHHKRKRKKEKKVITNPHKNNPPPKKKKHTKKAKKKPYKHKIMHLKKKIKLHCVDWIVMQLIFSWIYIPLYYIIMNLIIDPIPSICCQCIQICYN